jgi:hypothetical protein
MLVNPPDPVVGHKVNEQTEVLSFYFLLDTYPGLRGSLVLL